MGPTSEQIQRAIEGVTGEFYKPKTTAGEFAQTGGEFAASLLGGKGGAARRVAQWVGSTLGAEGASRLADALNMPGLVPYAKMAGGLAGGIIPGLVPRRAAPTPPGGKPAPHINVVEEAAPSPSPPEGHIAVTLHEQAPGAGTGHLRGVLDLPYNERLHYTGRAWSRPGSKSDAIHEALGIRAGNTCPATGAFEGEVNPAHTSPMNIKLAGDNLAGESKSIYEAGEKTRALFSGQHAIGWQALIPETRNELLTSVRIPHQGPLDPAKAKELSNLAKTHGFLFTDWGNGVHFYPLEPKTHTTVQQLLEGELGRGIRAQLPDANSVRVRMASGVIPGLEGTEPPGAATKAWLEALDRAPPEAIAALGRSSVVRDLIEGFRARDASLAGQTIAGVPIGPALPRLQHLQDAATRGRPEDFIQAVREAYRRNPEAFPAVLLPLIGGPLLYQAGPNRDQL